MNPYVFHCSQPTERSLRDVGGKANSLLLLKQKGVPVPDFFCVSAQAFTEALAPIRRQLMACLAACEYEEYRSLSATSTQIRELIIACPLPDRIGAALNNALDMLPEGERLSVRSSATNEDGDSCSFAGQLGTWLNLKKPEVEAHVRACWASAFEPGVLTYMHRMQRDPLSNPVGVVVQCMVHAVTAGVLFQADPQGDLPTLVIAAGYGLGEGVVSDKVDTDLYRYNKLTHEWTLDIHEKKHRVDYGEHGGTQIYPVELAQQCQPALTATQRERLLQVSRQISHCYDRYQDIEWAFDQSGTLYILQSRPITTLPRGKERVFDNSNIIESYPGVVLPMTFSLFHRDYYLCIQDALRRFGAPASVIARRDEVLQHLVGYIHGRAYYNLGNWYQTLLVVPFFRGHIIRWFEQMIGSNGTFNDETNDLKIPAREQLQMQVSFPLHFIANLLRHDRLIHEYFNVTAHLRQEFEALSLENAASDELIGVLDSLSRRFMKQLGIPILNDFFAMIFMALTREQFRRAGLPNADHLLNQLLSHQHIESTRPVISVQKLVTTVREQPALFKALSEWVNEACALHCEALYRQLDQHGFTPFREQLQQHIERYGHRSPKELIMEAETFRENPLPLLQLILESARNTPYTTRETDDVETHFAQHLTHCRTKPLLKWLLKKTRQVVAHREATRLDRGLHFSFYRRLLHRIGERLVEECALSDPRDVFYLTLPELDAYRTGCSPSQDLKGLVQYRRQQAAQWLAHTPQERLVCCGSVYANRIPERVHASFADNGDIKGTGCSKGEITTQACIVKNPTEVPDIKGKILVSETTDPGWVFLMVMSGGLISERGSLLSHTAIIGRELGIPTIVGVKDATHLIPEGATISMNGQTGCVHIHG